MRFSKKKANLNLATLEAPAESFQVPRGHPLDRFADALFYGSPDALVRLSADKTATPIERQFISVMNRATMTGNVHALKFILDYFLDTPRDFGPSNAEVGKEGIHDISDEELERRMVLLGVAGL